MGEGDGEDDGINSLFTDCDVDDCDSFDNFVAVFGVVKFDGNDLIGGIDSVWSSIGFIVLKEAELDSEQDL